MDIQFFVSFSFDVLVKSQFFSIRFDSKLASDAVAFRNNLCYIFLVYKYIKHWDLVPNDFLSYREKKTWTIWMLVTPVFIYLPLHFWNKVFSTATTNKQKIRYNWKPKTMLIKYRSFFFFLFFCHFYFTDSEMRGLSVTYYGSGTQSINKNIVKTLLPIAMFLFKYFV